MAILFGIKGGDCEMESTTFSCVKKDFFAEKKKWVMY